MTLSVMAHKAAHRGLMIEYTQRVWADVWGPVQLTVQAGKRHLESPVRNVPVVMPNTGDALFHVNGQLESVHPQAFCSHLEAQLKQVHNIKFFQIIARITTESAVACKHRRSA